MRVGSFSPSPIGDFTIKIDLMHMMGALQIPNERIGPSSPDCFQTSPLPFAPSHATVASKRK